MGEDGYLTAVEAAARAKRNKKTIQRACKLWQQTGRGLPAFKQGNEWHILPSDLERWLRPWAPAQRVPPAPSLAPPKPAPALPLPPPPGKPAPRRKPLLDMDSILDRFETTVYNTPEGRQGSSPSRAKEQTEDD